MRRSLLLFLSAFIISLTITLLSILPVSAQNPGEESKTDPGTFVLCLPDIYLLTPGDCLPAGPSAYRTQMAEKGITEFPLISPPGNPPARDLTYVNTRYGEVVTPNAPVFSSLDAAQAYDMSKVVRHIDSSFSFISYSDEAVVDGARYYMIEPGEWMTSSDISRVSTVPLFQGLTFNHTPRNAFGWILTIFNNGPVESKRTPGTEVKDYTGHFYKHHDVVQVYSTEKVGNEEWYMIGPDEWVNEKVVARVIPNTIPPLGVPGDRWVEVNLFEQTLAVYDHRQLVFATLIASGLEPFWTRPGTFQIFKKLPSTPMRGSFEADHSDAYYLEDVPWTMYFDEARALHGAYWRTQLGFPQSHGCINLSVGDSRWLFDWAQEGDWVYVWDPSGSTPVDPDKYTAGGA